MGTCRCLQADTTVLSQTSAFFQFIAASPESSVHRPEPWRAATARRLDWLTDIAVRLNRRGGLRIAWAIAAIVPFVPFL